MEQELLKYGLPGIVILGMAWFILKLMKDHKEERKEWRESDDKKSEEMNKNIKENTNILSGLKTLLENRRHD